MAVKQKKMPTKKRPRIIETKLAPPKYSRPLVERDPLLEKLRGGLDSPLTVIKAPAGFGKTTLATQWRRELIVQGRKVGWLSLDAADNDNAQFLHYFLRALESAGCASAADAISLYRPSDPDAMINVATAMINDLQECDDEIFLFVDDFHHITSAAINEMLAHIIRYAPSNFHIVLMTRAEPALPLSDMRLSDRIAEIDVADLRFNYEDAKIFLNDRSGEAVSLNDTQQIFDMTEGWIAAIQWASIALKSGSGASGSINFSKGDPKIIAENIAQEVLADLPEETRLFLLKTSILDRFNGELCAAVTNLPNADEILNSLETQNLFVLPIENETNWYRYHPLFANYLQDRLVESFIAELDGLGEDARRIREEGEASPLSIKLQKLAQLDRDRTDLFALHRSAARWFQGQGMTIEAVDHALAGGDLPMALDLVETSAVELLNLGSLSTLMSWADRLPKNAENGHPRLVYALGWAYTLTCQLDVAREKLAALEQIDQGESPITIFEIEALRAAIWAYDDRPDKALELEKYWPPEGEPFSIAAGANVLIFALGMTNRYKAARKYAAWVRQSPILHDIFFPTIYRKTLVGHTYAREGDLDRAETYYREAIELAEPVHGRRSAPACVATGALADLLYERNRLTEIRELLANRFDVINESIFPEGLTRAYVASARAYFALNDTNKALDLLERLHVYGTRNGYNRAVAAGLGERLHFALSQNDIAEARQLLGQMEEVEKSEAAGEGGNLDEVNLATTMARAQLDLATGNTAAVIERVEPQVQKYEDMHRLRVVVRMSLLLAEAHRKDGDRRESDRYLLKALRIGEKAGLVRSFVDEAVWCRKPLEEFGKREDFPKAVKTYVMSLLDHMGAGDLASLSSHQFAAPAPGIQKKANRKAAGGEAGLTGREIEILELAGHGMPNKRIATALNVSNETVKWYLKRIYSKLDVSGRVFALDRARECGIIE